jgi:hypothetical protein
MYSRCIELGLAGPGLARTALPMVAAPTQEDIDTFLKLIPRRNLKVFLDTHTAEADTKEMSQEDVNSLLATLPREKVEMFLLTHSFADKAVTDN